METTAGYAVQGTAPLLSGQSLVSDTPFDIVLPEEVAVLPTLQPRGEPPIAAREELVASASEAVSLPLGIATDVVSTAFVAPAAYAKPDTSPSGARGDIDALIAKYAAVYELPVDLVHAVVRRESTYNPNAHNNGHWGLMQIKHATARGMGYQGTARGLLDPETNLKYAVKYLRGAYLVADGNGRLADKLYQRGYYYDAKRKGLLDETGLGRDRVRKRRADQIL